MQQVTPVSLVWITPNAEQLLGYIARVSNPSGQDNPNVSKLLTYMINHEHWSPFEMASMCVEINTTRDIGRQILRHRSFSFQEFCVAEGTLVTTVTPLGKTKKVPIEALYRYQHDPRMDAVWDRGIRVFDETSKTFVRSTIKEVFDTGVKECFRVTLEDGKVLECTDQHKFFTRDGYKKLQDVAIGDLVAVNGQQAYQSAEWMRDAKHVALSPGRGVSHIAALAGCSYHTVRKWLRKHGLGFSKKENAVVAGGAWNKGLPREAQPMFGKSHGAQVRDAMRRSSHKGADSNLWGGGKPPSFRASVWQFNAKWKNYLVQAHGAICVCCLATDTPLEVDHKLPVWSHPELAEDIGNLQLLCLPCHRAKSTLESVESRQTVRWKSVVLVEPIGAKQTYDIEVAHTSHNYVANGVLTHNSQRYADATQLGEAVFRECRMQDVKNRQNSIATYDNGLSAWWGEKQRAVALVADATYRAAVQEGIAKEVARAVLPEGMTPSKMYMTGTIRSWIHYLTSRTHKSTQKEHRDIAEQIMSIFKAQLPVIHDVAFEAPARRVRELRMKLEAACGENLDPHAMYDVADTILNELEN